VADDIDSQKEGGGGDGREAGWGEFRETTTCQDWKKKKIHTTIPYLADMYLFKKVFHAISYSFSNG
jgi:hypothetical protein